MNEMQWLIARETPHLRAFARALVRDPTLADDLVQDCVERALRKSHLWRRKGSLRGWLLRILYNIHLNGAARRRDDDIADGADPGVWEQLSTPATQDVAVDLRETVHALSKLPAAQRDAILLVALTGVDYAEAAWILGVPVGTLQSRLARGREALRRMVARPEVRSGMLRRVK